MSHRPMIAIDSGSYSLSEEKVEGVGLRLSEIAQPLSRHYRVRIIAPATTDPVHVGDAELVGIDDAYAAIAEADAVMFFDTADRDRVEHAAALRKCIVAECRAPIEHMHYPSLLRDPDPTATHQSLVGTYRRQLEVTHHFLCRSRSERSGLLVALCAAGRIRPADLARSRTLDHLTTVVPPGFTADGAGKADAARPLHMADFLWTGGLWSWYEPLMLVEAVRLLRDRGVDTTAAFLYGVPGPDTRDILAELDEAVHAAGLADRVTVNDRPLALSQRDQYLKAAKGSVCVGKPGAENETGLRLRLRDSRLHGIPMIVDNLGLTGDIVTDERLGIALRDPDPDTLAAAMESILTGEFKMAGRRDEYRYERTLAPFMHWLDSELDHR
jgi:glycosyltransferase involved in cell wall biosynthesis